MVETLFGSGPQLWPTVPLSAAQSVYYQGPRVGVPNGPAMLPEINGGITAQGLLSVVAARRGQVMGPGTDADIEDIISDALDVLPGATEIEVKCEEGKITLSGAVPHKRVKRDAGEIAWAIAAVNDVQNNITISARRRSRTVRREGEATQSRKSA